MNDKEKNNPTNPQDNAPGQNKTYTIEVNTRERTYNGKEISFRDVVLLAFPDAEFSEQWIYTVTYRKGHEKNPKGTMVDGGNNVHLQNGMQFDVERNNRS